jgi:esterase/lipase superfamily enzyme
VPLAEFIAKFDAAAQAGGKALHLVAHSMGNRVLLGALRRLAAQGRTLVAVDQIVCAAPDVEAVEFTEALAELRAVGKRRTLYASTHDKPLWASHVINAGNDRAGRIPPVTRIGGLDTIDASGLEATFLGHSDFATQRPLLSDLYALLKENSAPERRIGLEAVAVAGALGYWRIR